MISLNTVPTQNSRFNRRGNLILFGWKINLCYNNFPNFEAIVYTYQNTPKIKV